MLGKRSTTQPHPSLVTALIYISSTTFWDIITSKLLWRKALNSRTLETKQLFLVRRKTQTAVVSALVPLFLEAGGNGERLTTI